MEILHLALSISFKIVTRETLKKLFALSPPIYRIMLVYLTP